MPSFVVAGLRCRLLGSPSLEERCHGSSVIAVLGMQGGVPSGPSVDWLSFAAPVLSPGTLRLNGGQPSILVIGNNTLGDLIFFRGKNFPT